MLRRRRQPLLAWMPLDVDVCRAAGLPDAAEIRRLAVPQPFGRKRRLPAVVLRDRIRRRGREQTGNRGRREHTSNDARRRHFALRFLPPSSSV